MNPPLDPQVASYLSVRSKLSTTPTHLQTPEQHRQLIDRGPFPKGPELHEVTEDTVEGPGGPIPIRIYRPHTRRNAEPVLLFLHGGGWLCGTLDSVDGTMRHLAEQARLPIVSIDYRRAPEHKFPAALHDTIAVLDWVHAHAQRLGFDRESIAVGGGSAGGNLAAAACLVERDTGRSRLAFQLLVYPCLESLCNTRSYQDFGTGYVLTTLGMSWYWNHYLSTEDERHEPYAAPLYATRFDGLPPALIITASHDPLRDDGARYAALLGEAGGSACYVEFPGTVHGFFSQWHVIDQGMAAIGVAADGLRNALVSKEPGRNIDDVN